MRCAEKYNLQPECLAPGRKNMREMPMWYHALASKRMASLAAHSNATKCLKRNHKILRVGEFEQLAALGKADEHVQGNPTCGCENCELVREHSGCADPDACYRRAEEFLNTLPPRWDPRGEHPEDYERAVVLPERDGGWKMFDWTVTCKEDLGSVFRIFTEEPKASGKTLDMRLEQSAESPLKAATDGSCLHNGTRQARAGAGVYMSDETHEARIEVRLPETLEQSNQAAEMLAIKIAAEAAPYNRELRIESDSKWAIGELTDLRDKHEDEGHIDSTCFREGHR